MRLEMRRVNHSTLWLRPLAGECCKNAIEDAEPTPADEAVVERLMGTIAGRRVLPLQAFADHVNNAADDSPVVDPRHTVATMENKGKSAPSGAHSAKTDESSKAS